MRVGEGVETFDGLKRMFDVESVILGAKRQLYGRAVVHTGTYGAQTWDTIKDEEYKLNCMRMTSLRSICVVTRMDGWRNEEVRRRPGPRENISVGV